jgi:ubiquitin carboxyl-terminal hydrolase L3
VLTRLDPASDLAKLIEQATPLKPTARADLVMDSQALEAAHSTAASAGDTAAPNLEDEVDNHYVAFVKDNNGQLWELDGMRKGPIERGQLGPDEDVLSDKALHLGVKAFLKREEEAGGGELRFSLLVLGPAMD